MNIATSSSSKSGEHRERLCDYIARCENRLQNILTSVGWSKTERHDGRVFCPLNGEHIVPESLLNEHVKKCKWKSEGYDDEDVPLPLDFGSVAQGKKVIIDEATQKDILCTAYAAGQINTSCSEVRGIPETSDRYYSDHSREERLALHDHVLKKTHSKPGESGITLQDLQISFVKKEKSKTFVDRLKEVRDAKRRRTNYRGVHTKNKTQVEILREVIDCQMEMLKESRHTKEGEISESSEDHDKQRSPHKQKKHSKEESYKHRKNYEHDHRSRSDYKSEHRDRSSRSHRSRSRTDKEDHKYKYRE